MFGLGNKFGGARRAAPVEPTSQVDSTATVQGAQTALVAKQQKEMHRETTRARVESLTADLDAARADSTRTTQAEGRAIYEGQNSTAQAQASQQAESRVKALDAALAIAVQKDDEAQSDLEQAERDLASATKDAARERLLALAEEGEELFVHLKRLRADVVREASAARLVGAIEAWGERESLDYFNDFLKRANRSAAADHADSGAFMKYPNWTYCLLYVCGRVQPWE